MSEIHLTHTHTHTHTINLLAYLAMMGEKSSINSAVPLLIARLTDWSHIVRQDVRFKHI
jgi:hypothetical protein